MGEPRYRTLNVNGKRVWVVDFTITTKAYNAKKYLKGFLRRIPREDLEGIGALVLCDDSERVLDAAPGTVVGTYQEPRNGEEAKIYFYLRWSLGVNPFWPKPTSWKLWNVFRNKLIIALYGKVHIARALFHEVGHHHFSTLLGKHYASQEEAEREAAEYATLLYRNAFPIAQYWYELLRHLLHDCIYKKDWDNYTNLHSRHLSDLPVESPSRCLLSSEPDKER